MSHGLCLRHIAALWAGICSCLYALQSGTGGTAAQRDGRARRNRLCAM